MASPPSTIPKPHNNIAALVTIKVWPTGQTIHRVHPHKYGATEFNPGGAGDARFSPIRDATGKNIPTIYGGANLDCAVMETVFHDVPFVPGFKAITKTTLNERDYSEVNPLRDLKLADLSTLALRRLGISPAALISSDMDAYAETRVWAEEIYRQCPDLDGLCWTSRQHGTADAMVLFGDRVTRSDLQHHNKPSKEMNTGATFSAVLALAIRIGVTIV